MNTDVKHVHRQIFIDLTEPVRELHSIRYLCLNEPICALASLSSINKEFVKKIIVSLIRSRPPYKELFNSPQLLSTPKFHWLCFCISKELNIDVNFNILPILLQILQDDKNHPAISKILKALNNLNIDRLPDLVHSRIDSNSSKQILNSLTTKEFESIILLSSSSPPLFRALSPFFEIIFNIIDINKFYHQYGYHLLSIMNIEKLNLKSVTFNDYPQLEEIIQKTILDHFYYSNFMHSYQFNNIKIELKPTSTFLYRIQNNFFQFNPFPKKTFFGHYSLLYSLLNTSLATKTHFIDIMGKRCIHLFEENDFANALDSFSLIPQMKSWAVVAIYNREENRQNMNFLSEVLPLLPNDLKPNLSTEFLHRCNNDNLLKVRIIQFTGIKKIDLASHSIPYFFKQCLDPNGTIFDYEDIYQNQLLSYTDDERINDCDFMSYYFAIVNEIKCITDETNIDENLTNLNKSLRLFSSNYEVHNSIMIDLFSLLFLQVDGQFVCSSDAANKILPLLSSYVISDSFLKIFTKCLKKVHISNILFPNDHNLNHALLPISSLFDIALISHDWELAQQLENNDKRLRIKRQIFTEIYYFSQLYQINEEILNEQSILSLMISAEIGLSNEDRTDYLKIAKSNLEFLLSNSNSNSLLVISNQPTKYKEDLNVYYLPDEIKIVLQNRRSKPLRDPSSTQEFFCLSNKLIKITSTNWNETQISDIFHNYKLFCTFFYYLDGFIPVILNSQYAQTVTEALSVQPDKLIFHLYSQNKIKEANQVASALKMDVFETLILHTNHNKEFSLPFIKEYPIINYSEYAFSDNNNEEIINTILNNEEENIDSIEYIFNTKLLSKLISLKKTDFYDHLKNQKLVNQNNDQKDFEKYENAPDLFLINDIPTKYYEKVLTELVNESKKLKEDNIFIDIDKIAEFSFSVSSNFFDELIQKNISKFDLNELLKLCNMSNCTDKLAESVEFLNDLSKDFSPIFPLENLLKRFLSIEAYKLASEFCRIFRFQMNTSKVIREVALSFLKENKSIKDILNICEPLKNEIIESIPPRFKEKAIKDGDSFFDLIPKHWKRQQGPKTTFIKNLNDDTNAYLIFQKLPLFNVDHDLLSLFPVLTNISSSKIMTFEIIDMYTKYLQKLLKFFRNPFEPCQKVLNYLITIVSSINVDENSNELYISVLMHRVHTSIVEVTQTIKDFFMTFTTNSGKNQQKRKQFTRFFGTIPSYCEYIRVLSNFVLCFLNTKYGIIYSFHDFQSKQKASELMEICFKYDIPTIGTQFMNVWNLTEQSFLIDNYSLILFKLGRFDDGLKMCIDRRMKKSLRTMAIVDQFVDTCSYSQLYDQNTIEKLIEINDEMFTKYHFGNNENKDLYDYISNDLQVNRCNLINSSVWNYIHHSIEATESDTESSEQFVFMPIKTSEASLRAGNRYLKLKAPLFMRVKKLVINGNFDKALKLAMNNNNQNIYNTGNVKFKFVNDDSNNINNNNNSSNDSSSNSSTNDLKSNNSSNDSIINNKAINNNNSNNDNNSKVSNNNETNLKNNSNNNVSRTTSSNRNTKIMFSTENICPGSPNKSYINNNINHQRMMQERFNLFLENIFMVSISYSNFSKMKVKLLEFDPTLHFFGSLVEKLLQFAMNNSMPHLKFELEMFLGRTDSAAVTSISLYNKSKSIPDLENALKAVKKDLSSRRDNTKMAPSSLSLIVIESYAKIIPLQIKFMKFLHQQSLTAKDTNKIAFNDFEYNKSLSLFNGKKSATSIVIVLFRQFNFSLALEIINTCKLNLFLIADALCDVIYNERNSAILKLVRSLEDSFPDELFMKIINRILFRLFYVIDDGNDLALRIIENAMNNEEFRTKLFIQFGEYEKAFENAKKWKLFHLMPLIAHEALMKDPGNQSCQIATSVSTLLAKVQRSTSLEF